MAILHFLQLSTTPLLSRILLILSGSCGILLSIAALFTYFIPTELIVATLITPLSAIFSSDGIVSEATITLLQTTIHKSALLLTGTALLCFTFTLTGIFILQNKRPTEHWIKIPLPSTLEIIFILSLLAAALLLRLTLMPRGLCYDELFSTVYSIGPRSFFGDEGRFMTSQHIGYTPLAIASSAFFGLTEWAVRLPSLILGLVGIFTTWFIGRRLFSAKIMLITAGFLAISPAHIAWSSTARGYSGYILTTTLLILLTLSMLKAPKTTHKIFFPILVVTGYFFHSLSIAFFAAITLHLCGLSILAQFTHKPLPAGIHKCWQSIGITAIAFTLVVSPFILRTFVEVNAHQPQGLLTLFPINLWNALLSTPWNYLNGAAFLLLILGLTRFWRRSPQATILLMILLLLPIGMWLARPVVLYERFWIGLLPFIFLLMAEGLVFIYQRSSLERIFALGLTLLICGGSLHSWGTRQAPMIKETSWTLREDLYSAEETLPAHIPIYALKGHDQFFRYYLHRPVVTLDTETQYIAILQENSHPVFFILPSLIKSASKTSRPILDRLRTTASEKKYNDLSVFTPLTPNKLQNKQ